MLPPSRTRDGAAAPPARGSAELARPVGAAHAQGALLRAADDSAAPVPAPVARVVEERRVLAIGAGTRRAGRWAVPRLLRVRAFLGNVTVDLRGNAIPDGCRIDVRAHGSSVTVIVPPGVAVVFDVFAVFGNAVSQADEPGAPGGGAATVLRVTGSAVCGEVRVLVRGPAA